MQTPNLMMEETGPDLVIRLSWAERMVIAKQLEELRHDIESSFERIFGNEKSRLEADSNGRKE